MNRYAIIVSSLLLLQACQPEPLVLKDVPQAESKMVVSTITDGDNTVGVFLTRSFAALEGFPEEDAEILSKYIVQKALVSISGAGQDALLNELYPGFYASDALSLIPGETYAFVAYDNTSGQQITANTAVLEKAFIEELTVTEYPVGDEVFIQVNIRFQDLPGKNYYMVNVSKSDPNSDPSEVVNRDVHTQLIEEDVDEAMIKEEFVAFLRKVVPGDTLRISLAHISPEYYFYLDQVSGNFIGESLLSEPYNYPTNVNGGYGFFNLHEFDRRKVLFGK
ncbi:MAG: DUF4249 domain-containing protein [Vicingaceae bacterium]